MSHSDIGELWSPYTEMVTAEVFQPISGEIWVSTTSGNETDGPEGIFLPHLAPFQLSVGQFVRWRSAGGTATLARMAVL